MHCRTLLILALLCMRMLAFSAEPPQLANGILLIAKPELADPNFRETVVLITQPLPGGGPLGVILNRPTEFRLTQLAPSARGLPEQFDRVYVGGPLARNQIIFLAQSDERIDNALRVLDDVYLSGDNQLLADIAATKVTVKALRAYAGYAGWAPRQLQAEIAAGGWYMLPADAASVFTADAGALWSTLIRQVTERATNLMPATPALAQNASCVYSAKNSLTLSIHDLARGLCFAESFSLMLSSSISSSR